jgi:hypothetical protein
LAFTAQLVLNPAKVDATLTWLSTGTEIAQNQENRLGDSVVVANRARLEIDRDERPVSTRLWCRCSLELKAKDVPNLTVDHRLNLIVEAEVVGAI